MTNPSTAMIADFSSALHERLDDHDRSILADLELMKSALTIRVATGLKGAQSQLMLKRLEQQIASGIEAREKHIRTHDMLHKLAETMDWPMGCPDDARAKIDAMPEPKVSADA
ncbi:hypothetical protein INR77_04490 [Erythrobacter sp. SCSIO 43205]|uniref:hypothetical protein n=1 Tax=Erythrobacter sp. SCSIO 43205 TaxID=2779361 RepID=UPI001CA93D94|nr:hypothetical protein [Erythrobacter sp. SCSIO 43205]UAB78962.1 hypothetical protein INR77_04490 [Erythrobacter sp. SCSIO 43205]